MYKVIDKQMICSSSRTVPGFPHKQIKGLLTKFATAKDEQETLLNPQFEFKISPFMWIKQNKYMILLKLCYLN